MRASIFCSLVVLCACNEKGSFEILEAGVDPSDTDATILDTEDLTDSVTPDDTDQPGETDDTTEPVEPPATADNCGTYIEPGTNVSGPTVISSGDASLEQLPGFGFDWTWEGCEAERRFDQNGDFVCEIVWEVDGQLREGFDFGGGPTFAFELTFVVDTATTTCANASDATWLYGFDLDWGGTQFQLQRTPSGTDSWRDYAPAPFEATTLFDEIELSYQTEPRDG